VLGGRIGESYRPDVSRKPMGPALMIALAGGMAAPSLPINQRLFGNAPAPDLRLVDAEIGMTLAEWRALPMPSGLTSQAGADCGAVPPSAVAKAVNGDAPKAHSTVVCDYETHYGKVSLRQSIRINRKYLARDPRYTFLNGRLAQIEFHASIDAFNAVMAAIDRAYGPSTETVRDDGPMYDDVRLPRVRKVWRLAAGLIQVTDPSSRPDELAVQLSAWSSGGISQVRPTSPPASATRSTEVHGSHA
jgi:hypothetical protein